MKRTIYVVDDQEPLLDLAVRVLRSIDCEWEASGFSDPAAALEAVKHRQPDAVISDQVMPGMQGCELLEQVRIASPKTIRVIMSGYVPVEKLNLITSAHQYLAKPFSAGQLKGLVLRSFGAQARMTDEGLLSVANSLRSIPSLPQAYHALMEQLKQDDSPGETIARMVGADPGLSIKVLQLANSPMFGQNNLVTDVVQAVTCLGTDLITATILSQSVFKHYESLKHKELDPSRLWSHCWETACIAQWFCREKKMASEGHIAFLGGLLHEVGRFVLIDNFPVEYLAACTAAGKSKQPLSGHLRETFQCSPTQLSSYLLELWGLPAPVVEAVSLMENPEKDARREFTVASTLYVADHLAAGTFPSDSFAVNDWNADYLQAIDCADEIATWEKRPGEPRCTSAAQR